LLGAVTASVTCWAAGSLLEAANEPHPLPKKVACGDIMEGVNKGRTKTSAQLTHVSMSNYLQQNEGSLPTAAGYFA